MAESPDVAAARAECARSALGGKPGQQPLDPALATAAATARIGQARDLLDGLRGARINRREDARRGDLITVAN